MNLCLSGYAGSKHILRASSYLIHKYLGEAFKVCWLNYGAPPDGILFGYYVPLRERQESVSDWASDLKAFLSSFDDELVIFALDDYLLCEPMNWGRYNALLRTMETAMDVVCARLCTSEFYRPSEIHSQVGEFIQLSDKAEYSSTTQYCIWRREYLIELLGQVSTPWEFEVKGSQLLNASGYKVIGSRPPALVYPDSSSLSARWKGVSVQGVKPADVTTLIELRLLNPTEIVNRTL